MARRPDLLFASLLAILASGAARAQDAPDGPSVPAASASQVGDIVVTAEKRQSTVQRTPIAISVLSSELLKSNGVGSLTDLATIAPGVSIGQNSVNTIVTIRGISSRDTTEIGDPAVSISLDGFYFQRPFGLNDSVYDLERVEVLRGPQGTLYGRNATGGAINFITAKPKDEFAASVTLGYGNYNLMTAEGFVNVPITDTLQARASFSVRSRDGYRTNNYDSGAEGDDADSKSARLTLKWKPAPRLTVLVTGQYTKEGGIGPVFYGIPLEYNEDGSINQNIKPNFDVHGSRLGRPKQSIDETSKSIQWNFGYDLDFATATYMGGYRTQKYNQIRDLDGLLKSNDYFIPSEDSQDWQHEVRLTSNGNGAFQWQVGGFYFQNKNSLATYFSSYANVSANGDPTTIFSFLYPKVVAESKAVFGQASYEVIDGLKVEGGIRYTKDDKSRVGITNTGGGDVATSDAVSSSKVTWHAAVNWQVTQSNLLYVKRDTGYKAGGFQDTANGTLAYGPENITSYEIGSKNRLFGGKLQLNLAGFYYEYKDQQISQFVDGFTIIDNAGVSHIWGIEADAVWKPTRADQFDAYVSYLHARFVDFNVDGVQYAGNRPPQSPTWTVNAGYQHEFALGEGKITPRIQTHYESRSYLGFENYEVEKQGRYTKTDFIITYTSPNDKWSLQGYVKNIENQIILSSAGAQGFFGAYTFQFEDPRTFGVRATVNF